MMNEEDVNENEQEIDLSSHEEADQEVEDDSLEEPISIRGWNWGAFYFSFIWGVFNNSYLTFLSLVPIINIIWPFYCGYKGNEWAWENNEWESVEQFHSVQRKWGIAALIVFSTVLIINIVCFSAISAFVLSNISGIKQKGPNVVVSDVNSNQNTYTPTAFEQSADPFANEPRILVKLEPPGRDNPFKPFMQRALVVAPRGKGLPGVPGLPGSEIPNLPNLPKGPLDNVPPPPKFVVEDPTLKSLVDAKVAGILYDSRKPSAIIKIDGTDYLVHQGDVISDFYIKKIGPKEVTIKTGNNEYIAGAGESIQQDKINRRTVYDLNNKFGGNRSGSNKLNGFNSKGVIY